MIDLKTVRDNPDLVRTSQRSRGEDPGLVDALLAADAERRAAIVEADALRSEQKALGKQVGKAQGDDKQALLAQLMTGHMDRLLAAWSDDTALPPLARLERFTRFHIAYSLDHADAVFLSYMELRNLSPDNHAAVSALRRRYEEQLVAILRDGQAAGVMAVPDTRLAAMALIAMLTGVTNWYREGGRLDRDRVGDIYWDLARGAVGA